MKIIVVAMAKNEEVFIESSIRYWFTFADQIILFNHYSTDGTTAILEKLTAEFEERLTLFHPQFPIGIERNQEIFTNAMTEAAFRQYGADLVLPLDTDEYPYLPQGGSLQEFLRALPQDSCYKAYWMPFAPPLDNRIDHSVFAPLAFTRKKRMPMPRWEKTIITRTCYNQYHPMLTAGNHDFVNNGRDSLPPREDLTPRLFYAHYACRGKEHYIVKNLHGWLTIYSQLAWTPGHSLQYQLACEQILKENGNVSQEVLDWYALSSNGMTGESVEDIQNSIETVNPREMFPEIAIQYTPQYIVKKKTVISLYEAAIQITEQYREACLSRQKTESALAETRAILDGILTSKSWKLTKPLRYCMSLLRGR